MLGSLTLSMSLLLWSPMALAGPTEAGAKQAAKAAASYENGDIFGTLRFADKALKKDPNNTDALYLRSTAYFTLAQSAGPNLQPELTALANADKDLLADLAPNSVNLGILSDLFTEKLSLALPDYGCSVEATGHFNQAEAAFGKHDLPAALVAYDRSLALCPDNATAWVFSGDALFGQGDNEGALQRYNKAIEITPCHWQAHRFSADLLIKSGQPEAAWTSFTNAVACNPGYEAAWNGLKGLQEHLGRPFTKVSTAKPSAATSEGLTTLGRAWVNGLANEDPASLDQEIRALSQALAVYRANPSEANNAERPFWQHLDQAEQAGFLTETLLVQLFNDSTISLYVEYATNHREQLLNYVQTEVAPPR